MKKHVPICPWEKMLMVLAPMLVTALLLACTPNDGDELPQNLKVSLSPRDTEIPQEGLISITATTTPSVNLPLVFQWSTGGKYGRISDESMHYLFEEETGNGKSTVDYLAHPRSNPGGTDQIIVEVYNAQGVLIDVDTTSVTVKKHEPQIVTAVGYELITEGSIPGRINIMFMSAWIFKKIPGFSIYNFTVVEPPGEGWSLGPPGTVFVHSLRGALLDQEQFVNSYGSDIFDLGTENYALILAGQRFGNYDSSNAFQTQTLEGMRNHRGRLNRTIYSVEPAIR